MEKKPAIFVDKTRLYSDIEKLTSIEPPRNFRNIFSLNKAAEYIYNEFKKLKCKTELQKYKVDGNEYKNIICSFGPENAERVVVGAHYDVCGDQPGADDNASGVAGLLELARLIDSQNPDLKYRIELAAFTLEEPPFFRTEAMGSAIYVRALYQSGIKIKAMLCLEMIGFFSEEPNSQSFPIGLLKPFYPSKGNFIAVVSKLSQRKIVRHVKKLMVQGSNIDVYSLNAPEILPGIDFSDHLNFWKYGYQAVMITDTSFYRNSNYHQKTDTIETLNFDKMAEVIKGVYHAIVKWL